MRIGSSRWAPSELQRGALRDARGSRHCRGKSGKAAKHAQAYCSMLYRKISTEFGAGGKQQGHINNPEECGMLVRENRRRGERNSYYASFLLVTAKMERRTTKVVGTVFRKVSGFGRMDAASNGCTSKNLHHHEPRYNIFSYFIDTALKNVG